MKSHMFFIINDSSFLSDSNLALIELSLLVKKIDVRKDFADKT